MDGELALPETPAICLHLVDKHPEANLAPPIGTRERAQLYRWFMYLTNTLQPRSSCRVASPKRS